MATPGTTQPTDPEANSPGPAAGQQGPAAGRPAAKSEADKVEFSLLRSAIYHDLAERLWMRLHHATTFTLLLLGSGAIAAFGADIPRLGQLAGVAVAILSALTFVFDFAGEAQTHRTLRRRFYDLLADFRAGGDPARFRVLEAQAFKDEPATIHRLNRRAHDRAGESLFGNDFTRARPRD